eukprot:TRINITY_DN33392_c0_g2_i1.p1 TRINITY_DN33392_c0_g2~~TRINITY_DN33392_c0_g2_i1.p1  ORF type:complete len:392 (-),score=28.06 TRINITY_DN33392_c0_g2_i1:839-2014(-)
MSGCKSPYLLGLFSCWVFAILWFAMYTNRAPAVDTLRPPEFGPNAPNPKLNQFQVAAKPNNIKPVEKPLKPGRFEIINPNDVGPCSFSGIRAGRKCINGLEVPVQAEGYPPHWDNFTLDMNSSTPIAPKDIPIYIISVPGSPRRRSLVHVDTVERLGVQEGTGFVFWNAYSSKLPVNTTWKIWAELHNVSIPNWKWTDEWGKGQLNTVLSHMELWHHIATHNWPIALIMEDDAHTLWDEIDLRPWLAPTHQGETGVAALHDRCPEWGAQAMVMTRKMAQCLWKHRAESLELGLPIDWILNKALYSTECPQFVLCQKKKAPFTHAADYSELRNMSGTIQDFGRSRLTSFDKLRAKIIARRKAAGLPDVEEEPLHGWNAYQYEHEHFRAAGAG